MIYAILFLVICIEFSFHPRLDKTSDNDLLLWYNLAGRRHFKKICRL